MSVVGFDFGQQNCYVGVCRQGGVEVITNDYSLHATPSCVQFDDSNRTAGTAARQKMISKLKTTVAHVKHLIGRRFDDPIVQRDIALVPCKVVAMPDGMVGVEVDYLGETRQFSIEQIVAMILSKLKDITEAALQRQKVSDCVIAVPVFFTQAQRIAMRNAAQLADLNCLKLINEPTAIALAYGMYKKDLPPPSEKARKVLFVDIGNSQATISIADCNAGKVLVRGTAFDLEFNGRAFDRILAEKLCDEFKQKYKIDVRSSRRHYFRLLDECEKLKKQMSANTGKLAINIESFMEDKDVTAHLQRSDLEEVAEPLFQRFQQALVNLLEKSGTKAEDIDVVEMVGGVSRMPRVKAIVQSVVNKEPSTTLNMDEAVARGAAMQCAILSPVFKVKEFDIKDTQSLPIKLRYTTPDNQFHDVTVFDEATPVPGVKKLTVKQNGLFQVETMYARPAELPYPTPELIKYEIDGVTPNADGTKRQVSIKIRIDKDGIFSLDEATITEVVSVAQTEPTPEPMETNEAAPNGDEEKQPPTDQPPADGEKEKKKKTKKQEVPLTVMETAHIGGLTPEQFDEYKKQEQALKKIDNEQQQRQDAKNAVEEYVYEMRDKLSSDYEEFVAANDADAFRKDLTETEDWLYDDGENCAADVYQQRLQKLRGMGDPIVERYQEFQKRPAAFERLGAKIQQAQKVLEKALAGDETYAHLEPKELDKVRKAIDDKQAWLDEKAGKCASKKKTEPPPVFAVAIDQETELFDNLVTPIIYRPKPKPKQPPPPRKSEENSNQEAPTTKHETQEEEAGGGDSEAAPQENGVPMDE